MIKHRRIKDRGKISFARFFQKFNSGNHVAIVRDLGIQSPGFPARMQGRTGVIIEKRGSAYVIELNDYKMKKKLIVRPIHLKKIKTK